MAAVQGSWRPPPQSSLASSVCVKNAIGSDRLHLTGRYPSSPSHSAMRGEKRLTGDDGRSLTSKFSRVTYSSHSTIRNSWQPTRTCSNLMSISREDFFKPGTIVLADHFEEAFNNGSTVGNDKSIIQTPGQKDICRKTRLFIVLAAHAQTYVSLPLYSHNGNGTRKKPKPEEYVSVRDHRAAEEAPPQSIHDPLTTEEMSGRALIATSAAHLAYPVARSYVIPVTVVGRLSVPSTIRLIRLFKMYTPAEVPELTRSSTAILASCEMSLSHALKSLRLHQYIALFPGFDWTKASSLTNSVLETMGIMERADRERLALFFEKVKVARRSGSDWKLMMDTESLAIA